MLRQFLSRLVPVWLVLAVVDGLCASALSIFGYGTTATRLWQGVASTVIGPSAFEIGWRGVAVGLLLHAGVALAWSAVFVALVMLSARVRRLIATPGGALAAAALYGPAIWLVMSLVVIPLLTGRPPSFNLRWWVQVLAHVPFVAVPIVATTAWVMARRAPAPRAARPSPSSRSAPGSA
jgi:hypothetical protein